MLFSWQEECCNNKNVQVNPSAKFSMLTVPKVTYMIKMVEFHNKFANLKIVNTAVLRSILTSHYQSG